MEYVNIDPFKLLESMSESVLVTDVQLNEPGPYIVYVNPAFEQMTGWPREEIIGKTPRVLQGPKTDYSIFQNLKDKLQKGEIWNGRTVNYRKDGSEFYMDWSITPVYDESGIIYQYIAVQKEVTQIVKTEMKLQKAIETDKRRLAEIKETNQKLSQLLSKQNKTLSLFIKYVPEPVIEKALSDENVNIKVGEKLEVGLLFCDIRGFTSITENLKPDEVVELLNIYYSKMSVVIAQNNGVINEFVGDEIFVSFGAPVPIKNPELSAVRCSIDMLRTLDELNEILKRELNTQIAIGIGINYGTVIAGNLGSENRLTYSITGSPVITAKRIESLTVNLPNSILISQSIYDQVKTEVETKHWGKVRIKGKNEKINVYQVLGYKVSASNTLRNAT